MRPQPKEREPFNAKRLMVLAFSVIFGLFLGEAVRRVSYATPLGPLTFLLSFVAAVFVHELGHAAAAIIVHFQVQSFTVGPVMMHREAAGLRFRRARIKIGGLVTIVPVGLHDLGKRMLVVVVGGPASSFLFAALAFASGRSFGEPLQSSWMNPLSVVSGALGILSLIPMRSFYRSDGAQIWDLLRSPEKAERHCALLAIAGAAKAGLRPRDWNSELIAKALSLTDGGGSDVSANVIAYEAAMDHREFDLANGHLEAALKLRHKCPINLKSGLALDAAFFYSMVRADSTLAQEWLNECDRRYVYERYSILMVEAAVLLSDGKSSEAVKKAQESARLLPRAQFPGFAAAAKDWLDIILTRALTRTHQTTSAVDKSPLHSLT
jgi:hypothetical protein